MRDTLNLIYELAERDVGVRTRADPIRVDSTAREDPMAQLAVVLLGPRTGPSRGSQLTQERELVDVGFRPGADRIR